MLTSDSFFMVFKTCKCGGLIGCMLGDNDNDGDLIEHQNCKSAKEKKGLKKGLNLLPLKIQDLQNTTINMSLNPTTRKRAFNILNILKRDKYRCVICKSNKQLTIDHTDFTPYLNNKQRHKAWNYKLNNCRTLCAKCHITKNLKELKNQSLHSTKTGVKNGKN